MTRIIADISPTIDGYVAGPGVTMEEPFGTIGERIHDWHGMGDVETTDADRAQSQRMFDGVGAVVLGRRMFDLGEEPWGDDGAFGVPCFVVTKRPRDTLVKGPTTFTFVTDGLESAVSQAREAAGDKNIVIPGGGDIVRQCLAAGLIDELRLHVVPVLLGGGTPMFGDVSTMTEFEIVDVVSTPMATHITYRLDNRR
ncbi:MAG: dihydrofolate reductase family protein [Stackebrandtia sp.]